LSPSISRPPPTFTLFPYTTLFRSYPRKFTNPSVLASCSFYDLYIDYRFGSLPGRPGPPHPGIFADFFPTILSRLVGPGNSLTLLDRKSTRLNSSHDQISYAVFCLK